MLALRAINTAVPVSRSHVAGSRRYQAAVVTAAGGVTTVVGFRDRMPAA